MGLLPQLLIAKVQDWFAKIQDWFAKPKASQATANAPLLTQEYNPIYYLKFFAQRKA